MRNLLSMEERRDFNISILKHLKTLPIWDFGCYHIFLPIEEKHEVDTGPIIDLLWQSGKRVVVPRILNDSELEHILLEEDTALDLNHWGVPEPVEGSTIPVHLLDLVFVPLLAYDYDGHRVGYGKGYYDRFLGSCRADVLKVGLSFFDPVEKISDIAEDDIALDHCVSPSGVYSFSG